MSKHIHLAIIFSFIMSVSSLYSMDQLNFDDYNSDLTLWCLKKPIITLITHDCKKIVIYDGQQKLVQHTIQLTHNSFSHQYNSGENFLTFAFCDADNNKEVQHCIFDIRSGAQTKLPTFPGETFISSTCFHPTNHILAAHIYPEDVIQYWDIERQKWFEQYEKINAYKIPRIPDIGIWDKIKDKCLTYHALLQILKHHLSFTPDGKSIILDWKVKNTKKDNVVERVRLILPFGIIDKMHTAKQTL